MAFAAWQQAVSGLLGGGEKGGMATTREFWSRRQFSDCQGAQEWLLARQRTGHNYSLAGSEAILRLPGGTGMAFGQTTHRPQLLPGRFGGNSQTARGHRNGFWPDNAQATTTPWQVRRQFSDCQGAQEWLLARQRTGHNYSL